MSFLCNATFYFHLGLFFQTSDISIQIAEKSVVALYPDVCSQLYIAGISGKRLYLFLMETGICHLVSLGIVGLSLLVTLSVPHTSYIAHQFCGFMAGRFYPFCWNYSLHQQDCLLFAFLFIGLLCLQSRKLPIC